MNRAVKGWGMERDAAWAVIKGQRLRGPAAVRQQDTQQPIRQRDSKAGAVGRQRDRQWGKLLVCLTELKKTVDIPN